METLYLPYLTAQDKLETALERLEQTDSRAVVVADDPTSHRLYMNNEILDAWLDGKQYCSELPASADKVLPVLEGDLRQPSQWAQTAAQFTRLEHVLRNAFEEHLDFNQADYGLLYPPRAPGSNNMVLVVTRHETGKDNITGKPKVCACTPNHHRAFSPPSHTGDDCNQCSGKFKCY